MIDFHLRLEQTRLEKAVDLFAAAMKAELVKRAKEGKRGWDGDLPTDEYIMRNLLTDAEDLTIATVESPRNTEDRNRQCVDIANRCAILWFRHNRPQTETKPETASKETTEHGK